MKRKSEVTTKEEKKRRTLDQKESEKTKQILSFIRNKHHIVALIGAGISVDAGIPDFRSPVNNGFFSIVKSYIPDGYTAEDVFDYSTFLDNPSLFYSSIKHIMTHEAKPSLVHNWLKELQEEEHNIQHIFTQNIDGLESYIPCPVTSLHGLLSTGHCLNCGQQADSTSLQHCYQKGLVAICNICQGTIKPDIIFYNESVSVDSLQLIQQQAKTADLLLILGTSLSTYPVSNSLSFFSSCDIISINKTNVDFKIRPLFPPLSLQLLGSFRTVLACDKQCPKEELDCTSCSKKMIVLHDGQLMKRKYLSEWVVSYFVCLYL